ncbi:MAG: rod shape-determining protein MreC [Firmicutes bacterium]|nr:rod shape-determining protein MreC [Bacillota bacterium]
MRHFVDRRLRLLLLLAVLLAVGLTIADSLTEKSLAGTLVQSALAPVRSAANGLTRQAEKLYGYMFRYEALEAENKKLKEELANMQDNARRADVVSRENDRLRALIGLKSANESYEPVDAYVISWNANEWSSSFTINKGTASGVETGMCAVTANGEVVGLVTEAGSNYAVVKSILDASIEISAVISASGYNGVVRGAYNTGLAGMLRMEYVSSAAVIRNNDQVMTSGSTVYPRGLVLGNIVDAGFDDTGIAKYAIVKPSADIENLEQVFIITAFDSQ